MYSTLIKILIVLHLQSVDMAAIKGTTTTPAKTTLITVGPAATPTPKVIDATTTSPLAVITTPTDNSSDSSSFDICTELAASRSLLEESLYDSLEKECQTGKRILLGSSALEVHRILVETLPGCSANQLLVGNRCRNLA